jgi:hypothetical protein
MVTGTSTLDRRVETRPLPLDRVVKWLPRDDAFYLLAAVMTSASAEPLVVPREVLLQVERHLRDPGATRGCGILHGAMCACPRTRIRYLLIEGAVRAVTAITEHEPPMATVERLRALVREVERRGKRVVGWYRGGAAIVPRLSPRDVAVHRELFPDAWRVALLRDMAAPGQAGAFVRVEPVDGRAYLVPFQEVLPRAGWRDREAGRTAVVWRNYRPEREVEPLTEVTAAVPAPAPEALAPQPAVRAAVSVAATSVAATSVAADSIAEAASVRTGLEHDLEHDDADPRERESVFEPEAQAPPEPLGIIWVPPRVPEDNAAAGKSWRVWLWFAAAIGGMAALVFIWRLAA